MGKPKGRAFPLKVEMIQGLCQNAGLTITALAEAAGIHEKTLSRWLGGQPAFLPNIAALAEALGVQPQELMEGCEPKDTTPEPAQVNIQITSPDDMLLLSLEMAGAAKRVELYAQHREEPWIAERKFKEWQAANSEQVNPSHIEVFYIPGYDDERKEDIYWYAICHKKLHGKMMASLATGDIPHFCVVVAKGRGDPTAEAKDYIKRFYGFDHDLLERLAAERRRGDSSSDSAPPTNLTTP
jgi:transcriptional regulator with XRE-family HTH domain